jgi:hypothetical protein
VAYEEIDAVWREHLAARARAAVKALTKRGFDARFLPSGEEAVQAVLGLIPEGSATGCGGSVTLRQIGVLDRLRERGDEVVAHEQGMDPLESIAIRRRAVTCPHYLSSSNAVTLEGELVNVDGIGNRVAGMTFGPQRVIVVAGANKVAEDLAGAMARIRSYAAPANARRLGIGVPCVEGGQCRDCSSELNICRVTSIMHRPPGLTEVIVLMVGEALGF